MQFYVPKRIEIQEQHKILNSYSHFMYGPVALSFMGTVLQIIKNTDLINQAGVSDIIPISKVFQISRNT